MKKISLLLIGLLFIPTLFLTSCDGGDDPVTGKPAFSELKIQRKDVNDIVASVLCLQPKN